MKKILIIVVFCCLVVQVFSQTHEVPFTLEDRDRIMRTEKSIESLRAEMNAKFEAVDYRFVGIEGKFDGLEAKIDAMNSKFEPLYWAIGIFIVISLFTLGYIIWDRRTALYPVQDKTRNLEERLTKLEYVTREQAKKDPAFAELLKIAGLL